MLALVFQNLLPSSENVAGWLGWVQLEVGDTLLSVLGE